MGIVDIPDVEVAWGEEITSEMEPRVQYYIDIVSAYIEDYTGLTFSIVEDEEVVCRADKYGIIEFVDSVTVSLVEELDPYAEGDLEWPRGEYAFDGINTIYNLEPYGTYRITISYGTAEVPASLQGIAVDLVLAATGLDPSAANGLVKKRVGDREEVYGVGGDDDITLSSIQAKILDRYRGTSWTIRT